MSDRRVIPLILADPLTWVVGVITLTGIGLFFWWFQPGPVMAASVLGVAIVLLLAWPVLLLRSPEFRTRLDRGNEACLLYTSPSPRDGLLSRMPSSA